MLGLRRLGELSGDAASAVTAFAHSLTDARCSCLTLTRGESESWRLASTLGRLTNGRRSGSLGCSRNSCFFYFFFGRPDGGHLIETRSFRAAGYGDKTRPIIASSERKSAPVVGLVVPSAALAPHTSRGAAHRGRPTSQRRSPTSLCGRTLTRVRRATSWDPRTMPSRLFPLVDTSARRRIWQLHFP